MQQLVDSGYSHKAIREILVDNGHAAVSLQQVGRDIRAHTASFPKPTLTRTWKVTNVSAEEVEVIRKMVQSNHSMEDICVHLNNTFSYSHESSEFTRSRLKSTLKA